MQKNDISKLTIGSDGECYETVYRLPDILFEIHFYFYNTLPTSQIPPAFQNGHKKTMVKTVNFKNFSITHGSGECRADKVLNGFQKWGKSYKMTEATRITNEGDKVTKMSIG